MPAGDPPHKTNTHVTEAKHRCNMLKLAIEPYSFLNFSDYEIKREGLSYSAITLTEFSKQYEEIFFIIGADSLFQLRKWYHPEVVLSHCTLLVANRERHPIEELINQIDSLKNEFGAKIELLDTPDIPVSSTDIRFRVENQLSINGMVDPKVEQYILEQHLYR